ncbi:hypothetical protein SK128_005676 [Halocaridina rubra]|uniref:Transposase n=1 Tax=Halocaridina rubra TaxID=373956 RepID=A0AAN8WY66_HALRR
MKEQIECNGDEVFENYDNSAKNVVWQRTNSGRKLAVVHLPADSRATSIQSVFRWAPVCIAYNQIYIHKYLKDYDYYERCLTERQREENPIKPLKRSRNTAGCLCFTSKSRRKAEKQNYRTM